ncbi:hypothetical protein [Alistipes sp. An54]|uniref:hypothetical protein n=1 Tax=Alistipes sp. An54 TaxID=1965645 RepID=UPI0011787FB4|nr:hypothetical protein [Alistipes sp. An54]
MKDKEAIRQYLNSVWETMDNNPDSITREDFDRILDNATHCRLIFLEGSIAAIMPQLRSELKDILPPNTTCDIALKVCHTPHSELNYNIIVQLLTIIHNFMPSANIVWGCNADTKLSGNTLSVLLLIHLPTE